MRKVGTTVGSSTALCGYNYEPLVKIQNATNHMQIITYGLVAFFHWQTILKALQTKKTLNYIQINLNDFKGFLIVKIGS